MSILPIPRFPKLNTSVGVWAQGAQHWEMRRWIVESRSIEDLFEFIAANKNAALVFTAELNSLAQQQIQTIMAAETHEHLRVLRAPPVWKDTRTYVSALSGFVAGLLSSWLAGLLLK